MSTDALDQFRLPITDVKLDLSASSGTTLRHVPVPTFPCSVKEDGQLCGTPATETWDYQDIIDQVNEEWVRLRMNLEMTGEAICDAHLEQCPEV